MTTLIKFIKNKRKFFIILVIVLAVFAVWRYRSLNSESVSKTAKVGKGTVKEELILSGEIKAEEHAKLNFLSSGELNYIGVKEGDYVKKGQVLAKLDSTNAYQTYLASEADLRRYQASLNNTYDQLQGHKADESYTQIETRTAAETNKDKAYRNFIIAQKNLSNLQLRAPFDGIIASVSHPFNGINTTLTESQIEIVNPGSIYFDVNADQTEITGMKLGQKVTIKLDSFPDLSLEGSVSFIGITPKQDEVGTVYKIKVVFVQNPEANLKIGMSGDANFAVSEKQDVLFVPPNFINSDVNGKYLNYERKNNKKYIEIGIEGEDRIEVKGEDIKEGDIVYD